MVQNKSAIAQTNCVVMFYFKFISFFFDKASVKVKLAI